MCLILILQLYHTVPKTSSKGFFHNYTKFYDKIKKIDKNYIKRMGDIAMKKSMFIMKGNLCSERVRVARAIRNLTQEELARKIQFMGEENMTSLIISRIEKNQRHVCDAELRLLAKALEVSMEWLVGDLPLFPL